ncbi:MAG: DinB family protein [Vicingaceae bacterium]
MTDQKRWKKELEDLAEDYSQLLLKIDGQKIFLKPEDGSWSLAELLYHVLLVNESYFPIFKGLIDRKFNQPFIARFEILARFFGSHILTSVQPDNQRKTLTQSIWQPQNLEVPKDIVNLFFNSHSVLIEYIRKSWMYSDMGYVIHSPANRMIIYHLDTAIEIIIQHERRHLLQARKIAEKLV